VVLERYSALVVEQDRERPCITSKYTVVTFTTTSLLAILW
jgi:hypothetical protein